MRGFLIARTWVIRTHMTPHDSDPVTAKEEACGRMKPRPPAQTDLPAARGRIEAYHPTGNAHTGLLRFG